MAPSSTTAGPRRRGRPFRLPEDGSPFATVHGGVNHRIAWLLATSRIYAADDRMAYREHFVKELNALGVAADQARVSRWESGNQRVPDRVVVAYEQLVGMAPGTISAAANGVRRALEPHAPANEIVVTTPEQIHQELDELFDNAYDIGHGSDWLALTNYLAARPNIYLRPDAWLDLSDRLIAEMARATGVGFIRRYEAMRTLIRHPGAQRHVVRAIGGFVTEPAAQSVMYPLTLLQEVAHPRAQELVLRLLGTTSGMLQEGAAWVAAAKLARGQFEPDAVRQLEALSVLMIAAGPRATQDVDIFDVAARLPEDALTRVLSHLREGPALPRLERLLRHGETVPRPLAQRVSTALADRAQEGMPPPYRIENDQMLQRLVREALFHGHQERRHQASILLAVSPYRRALAAACTRLVDDEEAQVSVPTSLLLRYLASESQRDSLLAWARDPQRPDVRAHALAALGRLPRGLDPDEEAVVLHAMGTVPAKRVQRACLYALGMNGSAHLKVIADTGDEFQARAARWWARIGPAIHEPAYTSPSSGPGPLSERR